MSDALDALDARFFGDNRGPSGGQDWESLDRRVFSQRQGSPSAQPERSVPVTDFSGNLRLGPLDTGIPLPEFLNKRLAQLGSGLADWGLRIDQLRGAAGAQDVADKRALDAQLRDGGFGKALGIVGQALPALAMPAVAGAPVLSGIAAGAASGFMQPVGEGESAAANTALGATLGAAIPGAASGLKWLVKPTEDVAKTAALAAKYGIPVGAADLSRNGFVKGLQSFTNDMPIGGIPGNNLRAAQTDAFTKAVGSTFGAAETRLTPDVVDAAKKTMGAEFDRLWGRNMLVADQQMLSSLASLKAAAADLPSAQSGKVIGAIDDFLGRLQTNQQGQPAVSGDLANKFQSWLRSQSDSTSGFVRDALGEARSAIIGAFNRSIGPADAAALTTNRASWKAFKTVEPILDKGSVGTAGRVEGTIPPALLSEAVRKSYRGLSSQTDQPALAELAQVGGRLLADRTPQTGGSARALIQQSPLLASLFGLGTLPINAALSSQALARAASSTPRGLLSPSSIEDAAREALLLGVQRSPTLLPGLMFTTGGTGSP